MSRNFDKLQTEYYKITSVAGKLLYCCTKSVVLLKEDCTGESLLSLPWSDSTVSVNCWSTFYHSSLKSLNLN